jgi:hypothetical protein
VIVSKMSGVMAVLHREIGGRGGTVALSVHCDLAQQNLRLESGQRAPESVAELSPRPECTVSCPS